MRKFEWMNRTKSDLFAVCFKSKLTGKRCGYKSIHNQPPEKRCGCHMSNCKLATVYDRGLKGKRIMFSFALFLFLGIRVDWVLK